MKILCVIDSLVTGGAQRQLVELAIGFKERGHEVSFLIYHQLIFFKETLDRAEIPVTKVIEPNFLRRFLKMRRHIRSGNFDAVLSFLGAANFIAEMSSFPWRRWRLVVGERSADPNLFRFSILKVYRWVHLMADYVVANSQENLRIVRKINPFLSVRKCKVIYNIVNFSLFTPTPIPAKASGEGFQLLVPSSIRALKNLNGLIEAVNHLSSEEKERFSIHWYGNVLDGSLAKGLAKIEKYGITKMFHFYPPVTDIHLKMQNADGVGLFSFHEGLPNAICEGMASGKVVICSRVSDVPRLLAHQPQSMFDPTNHHDITRVLKWALSLSFQEREEIGKLNRAHALKLFDKATIVDSYLTLLEPGNHS